MPDVDEGQRRQQTEEHSDNKIIFYLKLPAVNLISAQPPTAFELSEFTPVAVTMTPGVFGPTVTVLMGVTAAALTSLEFVLLRTGGFLLSYSFTARDYVSDGETIVQLNFYPTHTLYKHTNLKNTLLWGCFVVWRLCWNCARDWLKVEPMSRSSTIKTNYI